MRARGRLAGSQAFLSPDESDRRPLRFPRLRECRFAHYPLPIDTVSIGSDWLEESRTRSLRDRSFPREISKEEATANTRDACLCSPSQRLCESITRARELDESGSLRGQLDDRDRDPSVESATKMVALNRSIRSRDSRSLRSFGFLRFRVTDLRFGEDRAEIIGNARLTSCLRWQYFAID